MMVPNLILTDHFLSFEDTFLKNGGHRCTVRKDTLLSNAIETSPHTSYYIKSGIAKLSLINEEGSEHILFFLSRGEIFPVTCFSEALTTEYYLQLVAVTDLDCITFPANDIIKMNGPDNKLMQACIDHYVRYSQVLIYKLLMNTYNDSLKYLSSFLYLYTMHSRNDPVHTPSLTQEDIGHVLGLSRAQVARILAELRNQNLIRTAHGHITVLDMDQLRNISADIVNLDEP